MLRILIFVVFLCCYAIGGYAQAVPDTSMNQPIPPAAVERADSINAVAPVTDTTGLTTSRDPVPKRAGLYSAILPGAGQFYNKQYWKIPVIYAGMAGAGYFLQDNLKNYRAYRRAYIATIDTDPSTVNEFADRYPNPADLKQLQDGYRKFLDLTVLLTALGYTIQVMDAVAFAHLKNFDISQDISLHMQPVLQPGYVGFGLVARFK